jgi:hypothetical protein
LLCCPPKYRTPLTYWCNNPYQLSLSAHRYHHSKILKIYINLHLHSKNAKYSIQTFEAARDQSTIISLRVKREYIGNNLDQEKQSINQRRKCHTTNVISNQPIKRPTAGVTLPKIPDTDSRAENKMVASMEEKYHPQTRSQIK